MNRNKARQKRERRRTSRLRINLGDRTVTLDGKAAEDLKAELERNRERFREKFGRDPGPDDPVFWDPDAEQPKALSMETVTPQILAAMRTANIRPELIYAFEKTGVILTEQNEHLMRPEDVKAFYAAVEEYLERAKAADSNIERT
jgi:hypothetical protein